MDEMRQRTGDLAFGIERLQGGEVEMGRWPWFPLCNYYSELNSVPMPRIARLSIFFICCPHGIDLLIHHTSLEMYS
jgi:hypothetical protein